MESNNNPEEQNQIPKVDSSEYSKQTIENESSTSGANESHTTGSSEKSNVNRNTPPRRQNLSRTPIKHVKPMSPAIVVLSMVCGCIMFIGVWGGIIGNMFTRSVSSIESNYITNIPLGDTIDVLYLQGTISELSSTYDHNWTLNQIDDLMNNENNKGVLLYVNSPGGGVYESDELYLKLMEYKEVTGRPVYAYYAQTAASGAVYATMAADKIYANRMTMTGSIGVIMSLTDTTGLQQLIGIKTENITSGENKAMGNPLTDPQREILQSLIDESYEIFVGIVAEGRDLTIEETKKLADGRIYSPKQALELGLIDGIMTIDEAVADLQKNENLEDCSVYSNLPPASVWDEFFSTLQGKSNLDTLSGMIDGTELGTSKLMYYYAG